MWNSEAFLWSSEATDTRQTDCPLCSLRLNKGRSKSGPPLNQSALRHKEPDRWGWLHNSAEVSLPRGLCVGCSSKSTSLIILLKKKNSKEKGPKEEESPRTHTAARLPTNSTLWVCHQLQISPPATMEGGPLQPHDWWCVRRQWQRRCRSDRDTVSERSCSDIFWPASSNPEEIFIANILLEKIPPCQTITSISQLYFSPVSTMLWK